MRSGLRADDEVCLAYLQLRDRVTGLLADLDQDDGEKLVVMNMTFAKQSINQAHKIHLLQKSHAPGCFLMINIRMNSLSR